MSALTNPLVAVVTPVLNGAEYLVEAMDSVQAQTYPNLVHIVLDNASTDATPEILRRYISARVPVTVVRNERTLPMAANWNAAVALVPNEAQYFRVLSADDVIAPNFIARTVSVAERHPNVSVVGCDLNHREISDLSFGWEKDREAFPGQEAARRFFLGSGVIIAHQVLIRRRELEHRRPFFQEGLSTDDTDACLDMFRRGDWGYVHETLASTREHPGTDSNTWVKRWRMDACEHLILLERHAGFAFGSKTGQRWIKRYRRYYLRQLLRWRIAGQVDLFRKHVQMLRRFGPRTLSLQFVDAAADWPLARLGLSAVWQGYPFHQASGQPTA